MSTSMQRHLLNVREEVRRLESEIVEREWADQDPRFEYQELARYRKLEAEGILWEPAF